MAMMPTAYMNARLAGLGAAPAYAVQAVFAAAAAAAVVWAFARRREPLLSGAVLVVASLAATPYLMSYDLVVVAWLMMALAAVGRLAEEDRPLLLLVHLLPFVAVAGEALALPGSALVLPAFGAMLLLRMRREVLAGGGPPLPARRGGGLAAQ
jgi:hypothetical protein